MCGGPRGDPVGPGHRHGAVRVIRLLDESGTDRTAIAPGRGEGGAQDDRNSAENGQAPACGTGGYLGREAIPGDGGKAFLHRVGCTGPVQLVAHERGRYADYADG